MHQPDALKKNEPLKWSTDTGADVWELFCACLAGDVPSVRRLLEKDPSLARARELLDKDPALVNHVSDYSSYYVGCGAPIKNAAARGHLEVVRLLLERGADPNLPEEGIAPQGHALYSAAANGHYEVVQLLLEHGAHPNAEVESSADTLSRVISNGDQKMLELLCSHGAARAVHLLACYNDLQTAAAVFAVNPAHANDPEALANAAGEGHESFVRLMLRYHPDLPRQRLGHPGIGPQRSLNRGGRREGRGMPHEMPPQTAAISILYPNMKSATMAAMSKKTDVWQGTLALMVLKTLERAGALHGYGIARQIEKTSDHLLAVNYGTLYPALIKLEQEGFIASQWGVSDNNRKAKFYELTRAGRKKTASETREWEQMTAILALFLHPQQGHASSGA